MSLTQPPYSPALSIWKGLRSILVAALAAAAAAGVGAFIDSLTGSGLREMLNALPFGLGNYAWLMLLGAFEAVRNAIKNL